MIPFSAQCAYNTKLGSMPKVEETKLHILRGAVQDNFDTLHGIKSRPAVVFPRPRRSWLWGLLLLTVAAYFVAPSSVVSPGKASSTTPSSVNTPVIATVSVSTEPDLTHIQPRPLNRDVFPLALKRIVIDPGHGGVHAGAVADSGLKEKDITLDVALRLRRLMSNSPFEVLLTRDTDRTIGLQERVEFANANNADLFLSIHVNWMEPRTIRGPETFFVGPTDDPTTMKLVRLENRDSQHTFADLRHALDKIYIDARRDESRMLAKTIQGRLFGNLKQANATLDNRGVKTAPFVVLLGTQMPAVLVEISCLSNSEEAKLLTTGEYREKIALALLDGIRTYANNINVAQRKGS
jgi:N-acetylmuramoyl-L-alanine amidase